MRTNFQKFGLLFFALILISFSNSLQAQYNTCAGQNVIYDDYEEVAREISSPQKKSAKNEAERIQVLRDVNKSVRKVKVKDEKTGEVVVKEVERKKLSTDAFGNAQGSQFDLAIDGAFKGETVAVIQLYPFSFDAPKKALAEKGFSVYRWSGVPAVKELKEGLKKASQLWVISDCSNQHHLSDAHLELIKEFFDEGKGLYIWGDNYPCHAEANYIGSAILDITMSGDTYGDQTVQLKEDDTQSGIRQNHLITTGMNYVYEGITVATVEENEHLTPLIWGSAGNLVTAVYDQDGKRAIFDGGFTRLYNKWDTAGTGRYVKNAAAWLMNVENREEAKVVEEK